MLQKRSRFTAESELYETNTWGRKLLTNIRPAMNLNKKKLRNTNTHTNKLMLLNSPGELTLKEGLADIKIPPPLFLLLLLLMLLLLLLFLCFQCLCVYVTQHVPFLSRRRRWEEGASAWEHTRESTLRLLLTSLRCGCALWLPPPTEQKHSSHCTHQALPVHEL
jgi:hypothetical protein